MTWTLAVSLNAPLQAWGSESRFADRHTGRIPSKSAVIGLLCAALGRDADDTVRRLASLRFGVRVDAPGEHIEDFQTARVDGDMLPLSMRGYLAGAAFVAFVEFHNEAAVWEAEAALHSPVFTPYLGRKSCLPVGPLSLGVHHGDLLTAARDVEPLMGWQDRHYEVWLDGTHGEHVVVSRDQPLSLRKRHHALRYVNKVVIRPSRSTSDTREPYSSGDINSTHESVVESLIGSLIPHT